MENREYVRKVENSLNKILTGRKRKIQDRFASQPKSKPQERKITGYENGIFYSIERSYFLDRASVKIPRIISRVKVFENGMIDGEVLFGYRIHENNKKIFYMLLKICETEIGFVPETLFTSPENYIDLIPHIPLSKNGYKVSPYEEISKIVIRELYSLTDEKLPEYDVISSINTTKKLIDDYLKSNNILHDTVYLYEDRLGILQTFK